MSENQYAVTAWGPSEATTKELTLPSGQQCLVQFIEMEDVIALGVVNQLDTFTGGMLSQALDPNAKKPKKTSKKNDAKKWLEALKDKEKFDNLMFAVDKIIMKAVIAPKIHPEPVADESGIVPAKIKGQAYIDQVKFNDKMEIFSLVFNNLGDMSSFHGGQTSGVGDVAAVEGIPRDTLSTGGNVGDQGVLL